MQKTQKKNGKPKKNIPKGRKRKRKENAFSDIAPAVVLTAGLIILAIIISIVVIRADLGGLRQSMSEIPVPPDEQLQPPAVPAQPDNAPRSAPAVHAAPDNAPIPAPAEKPAPASRQESRPTPETLPPQMPPAEVAVVPQKSAAIPEQPPKHRGTVAFIIDDAGNNLQELEPFLSFPGPLTIAVLPGLPYSAEAARRIRAAGKEVFLHQPMEAVGGQYPGPGAIYAEMDEEEILAVLNRNLAEVGPVAGINNHQGSRITADHRIMAIILAFCRDQGIAFVDSRTTADTAAPAIARELGMVIGQRHIFIDNEQNRNSMAGAINSGLAIAAERGSVTMIGHAWSPELALLLAEMHEALIEQGYAFSTAAGLLP